MRLDPIQGGQRTEQAQRSERTRSTTGGSFREALEAAAARQASTDRSPIEFSKHALERLEQREIRLDDGLLDRLGTAIDKASAKGSQTTLVLLDQTAFVVGVPSRTVVTVADQSALRERVFTNIDSMVIA